MSHLIPPPDYVIVTASNPFQLQDSVSSWMNRGYAPVGGPTPWKRLFHPTWWMQAVVRTKAAQPSQTQEKEK